MLKIAFAVAAVATALSLGAVADRAAAMPSATPTQLGLADADTGLVQKTAVVCSRWGCRRVFRGRGYGSDLVARSTALPAPAGVGPARVSVGLAVLVGGVGGGGAVRDGAGRLIAMTTGA